jgi:hypothetical protein
MARPKRRYPRCAVCGKVTYPTNGRALSACATLARSGKVWRAYKAPGCTGWHVTSSDTPPLLPGK